MNRTSGYGVLWGMVLFVASRGTAQDKVYSVDKSGLKIEGGVAAGAPADDGASDTPTEFACSCSRPPDPVTSAVLIGCQLPDPSW